MVRRSLSPALLDEVREQRQKSTPAEAKLWSCLRNRQLGGYKFRRQHPAVGYVLDFYCPSAKLAVEVDGGVHLHPERSEYDRQRTLDLESLGIKVIRFWNSEVLTNLPEVLKCIEGEVEKRLVY